MTASATSRLDLPFLQAGQALKNITHNEALQRLDSGLYLSCSDMNANSLPVNPPDDFVVLISQTPETIISEHIGQIAVFVSGNWVWFTPRTGWILWDESGETLRVFDGKNWKAPIPEVVPETLPLLGLNASASTNQRLSLSSDSSLFNHDGNSHRLTINRANQVDTASLIFQTSFNGEAELGLTGSAGLSLKTSTDGSIFTEKLTAPNDYPGIRSPAFGSIRVSLDTDTAQLVPTPDTGGIIALTIVSDVGFPLVSRSGIFAYDTGATPALVTLAKTAPVENHAFSVPSGTTSLEGNIGISAVNGGIYLENRINGTRDISLTFLC